MSVRTFRARRIAAAPCPATPDLLQLHAEAENALSVALFYVRLPVSNFPGATRKAVQALAALQQLQKLASSEASAP